MQPILASSCARATTAAEARYRIDRPIEPRHGARIIALDDRATTIVRQTAQLPWNTARFFTLAVGIPALDGDGYPDIALHGTDATSSRLSDEVGEADVFVMVATTDADAAAASAIGRAAAGRGIMTAGVVMGDRAEVDSTVAALRPYARVLLVSQDDQDLSVVLTALRA
jgi:hypothetical protein